MCIPPKRSPKHVAHGTHSWTQCRKPLGFRMQAAWSSNDACGVLQYNHAKGPKHGGTKAKTHAQSRNHIGDRRQGFLPVPRRTRQSRGPTLSLPRGVKSEDEIKMHVVKVPYPFSILKIVRCSPEPTSCISRYSRPNSVKRLLLWIEA